jgi:hypothetical protein
MRAERPCFATIPIVTDLAYSLRFLLRRALMKKNIRKVAIRRFSRNLYSQLEDLPVAVYNKKTQRCVIVVISPEEGSETYEL